MKQIYYIVYYTIYRTLVWMGQEEETDMIRFNVAVIITIFIMLFTVGIIGFLIGITGRSIIVNSKIQSLVFALSIIGINAYIVFYNKRYREIERDLSLIWTRKKYQNIVLTLLFIVCSIAFF